MAAQSNPHLLPFWRIFGISTAGAVLPGISDPPGISRAVVTHDVALSTPGVNLSIQEFHRVAAVALRRCLVSGVACVARESGVEHLSWPRCFTCCRSNHLA